jgi:2-keto-4-pentenoate hydratase/2-oxohepta-3-ene-1,7-dioic acid hydratase in catechol pathway
MGLRLVRHRTAQDAEGAWSVVAGDHALPVAGSYPTTAALLTRGLDAARAAARGGPEAKRLPLAELDLLAPVTHPCRVIAQGLNYRSHLDEIGMRGTPPLVLFRKSSASLCGPRDAIVRPPTVRLLDYEVELGLVIGAPTRGPMTIEAQSLHHVVGALVVGNDVSARDLQVAEGQFYHSKSFRTFTPVGPFLFVPEPAELARWRELRLTLRVNGSVRQDGVCGDMVHDPARALTEISNIEDLDPGDLVLTGTPGGVALKPPPAAIQRLAGLLSEDRRLALFLRSQSGRREYLQPGDRVQATIRTPDGALDLGEQDNLVR